MKYTCSMETVQQNGRFTLFSSKFPSNIYSILFVFDILVFFNLFKNLQMFIQTVYLLKRTVNIVLSWSDPCKSMQLSIHKGTFKLIYRLCKILELKAQYFREKDSFDTNETFLRCTILEKSVKSFVIFHQHGSETFFTII